MQKIKTIIIMRLLAFLPGSHLGTSQTMSDQSFVVKVQTANHFGSLGI